MELVFLCPDITPSLPLSDQKKEELFRIIPPVLKMTLMGNSDIETVLFEVCVCVCAIVKPVCNGDHPWPVLYTYN